ncbi:MAG TPA: glutamyl-tRNA reductase [Gemmatimonadaceae bacterium]|nr:glutamyl-tRNA reductase [Gemmatimonadaceae bacterium]
MALIVAGVSHATAPIEVRERLAFRPQEAVRELAQLRAAGLIREGVILSTCNRTEVYAVEQNGDSIGQITAILSERLGEDASQFIYLRREEEAASHLFGVAAGLESMILGESQIHGQVKAAWEECRAESGPILNRMFQSALLAAARAREETGIGRGAASVSSAAVQLAKKIFGSLKGRRAMILGAGDVAEIALECLQNEGVKVAIVANRTFERAQSLAERHAATAMHYEECWKSLGEVDVLLCSTASPVPVVTVARVRDGVDARGDRPLCILDIALPRDVEAAVGDLDNVFLYDLDDLRAAASANLERREEDVPAAQRIIAEEVRIYWDWVAGLAAVPVVREFREEMEKVRNAELATALRRIGPLSPEQREALEHFSRALMNKFLHEPSVRLKAAAANGRGLGVVDAARYLFALGEKADSRSTEQTDSTTRTQPGASDPEISDLDA